MAWLLSYVADSLKSHCQEHARGVLGTPVFLVCKSFQGSARTLMKDILHLCGRVKGQIELKVCGDSGCL